MPLLFVAFEKAAASRPLLLLFVALKKAGGPSWNFCPKKNIILPSKRRRARSSLFAAGRFAPVVVESRKGTERFYFRSCSQQLFPVVHRVTFLEGGRFAGRKAEKGTERFYFLVPRIN